MNDDGRSPAAAAVRRLGDATEAHYHLVGRLAGGETGAHEVRGPDGARLVLKWEDDPSSQVARRTAVVITRRLHDRAGWPVPDQWIVEDGDRLFVLQELVAGAPVDVLSLPLLDQLLDLHERRLGLADPAAPTTWPDHLVETLVAGGSGYCQHRPLLEFDDRTARLVTRIEAIGGELQHAHLAAADLVHWDFHPGNLLQIEGRLSAVIDNDFATVGDAAFDLVTLALTSLTVPCEPGVRDRLFARTFDDLDEVRRKAYVGHLLIRFMDWSIRKGRVDEVDLWLHQAERFLPA